MRISFNIEIVIPDSCLTNENLLFFFAIVFVKSEYLIAMDAKFFAGLFD